MLEFIASAVFLLVASAVKHSFVAFEPLLEVVAGHLLQLLEYVIIECL